MEKEQLFKRALEESVGEVLRTFLHWPCQINVLEEKKYDESNPRVVASIGLSGPLSASLSLVATHASACRLVSRMLGCEILEINQDVVDGIGELLNITAGRVKVYFQKMSYPFALSIPAVIVGVNPSYIAKLRRIDNIFFLASGEGIETEIHFSYSLNSDDSAESAAGEGVPESQAAAALQALKDLISKDKK